MRATAAWSTQQLAEFLGVVSSFETEAAAALGAVERAAEAVDAEVAAIVRNDELIASVGYPAGAAPVEELVGVARGLTRHVTIPGAGAFSACVVPLDSPTDGTLVVARSGSDDLSREEVSLLHGMARVTSMTLRLFRLLEQERAVRDELAASRKRVVAAADEARRRIERDLHDGAQQQLVTLGLKLRGVEAAIPAEMRELRAELADIHQGLSSLHDGLREISRGLHPAVLSEAGLGPALKSLVRRSSLPVQLELRVPTRLPESVEVAAYYVVSEALTNAAKHAQASVIHVQVKADDGVLRVSIVDDGRGGADAARGSGIVGLRDRVEALGGTMEMRSPPGDGTSLVAGFPLEPVVAINVVGGNMNSLL